MARCEESESVEILETIRGSEPSPESQVYCVLRALGGVICDHLEVFEMKIAHCLIYVREH